MWNRAKVGSAQLLSCPLNSANYSLQRSGGLVFCVYSIRLIVYATAIVFKIVFQIRLIHLFVASSTANTLAVSGLSLISQLPVSKCRLASHANSDPHEHEVSVECVDDFASLYDKCARIALNLRNRQHSASRRELRSRTRSLGTFALSNERLIALSQSHANHHALGPTSLYFDILEIQSRIFDRRGRRWRYNSWRRCDCRCNISFRFRAIARLFVTRRDRNFPMVDRHLERRLQHRLDVAHRRLRTHFHRRNDVDLAHRSRLTRHDPNIQHSGQRPQLPLCFRQRQHASSDRRRRRMRQRITRCCEGHGYSLGDVW